MRGSAIPRPQLSLIVQDKGRQPVGGCPCGPGLCRCRDSRPKRVGPVERRESGANEKGQDGERI